MKVLCVFCKTGSENVAVRTINTIDESLYVVTPTRMISEKYNGRWVVRERLLIPGYVFVYFDDIHPLTLDELSRRFFILRYDSGTRELQGYDYEYAMWIHKHNGVIGESKALYKGEKIRVISGPLSEGIGTIVKLDRHKRRALVEFDFYGKIQRASLSVVDVEKSE